MVAGVNVSKAMFYLSMVEAFVDRFENSGPSFRRLLQPIARAEAT